MGDVDEAFEELLVFLKTGRGFDFTGYKRPSLRRRIDRRMEVVGVDNYTAYLDYLEVHPDEFTPLFNTILINVTRFFRDADIWSFIESDVIPEIIAGKQPDAPIRVWSVGCASGEEAYSAAILFAEALGRDAFTSRVKIYGTDIDEEALLQARQGVFESNSLDDVPANLRGSYFSPQETRWAFDRDLRRALIFGRHDLVQDSPISRIDLLLCRNTLMYFNPQTQSRVMSNLHFALRDGGFVVLGKAEMLFARSSIFIPFDVKRRVFRKGGILGSEPATPRSIEDPSMGLFDGNMGDGQAAFEGGPMPQIVVDTSGRLALANDQARSHLGLRMVDLGKQFSDLELSYRPAELRGPIEEVTRTHRSITISSVQGSGSRSNTYTDIYLTRLTDETGAFVGVSITFRDVTQFRDLQMDLERANQELETAMEELQSTNEELETMNEELQSTNEELETTNEELQSTNEELETMNEELRSTNEEFSAVNEEMRIRTGELNDLNSFLESVMRGFRSGVVVVDAAGLVSVWNSAAEDQWGLRADEARGKAFLQLDIGLDVSALKTLIRSCLDGGTDAEPVVLEATNRRGKKVTCHVTGSPLRNSSGAVHGVILLTDVEQA